MKYLLFTYQMMGTLLGTWETSMNNKHKNIPAFVELNIQSTQEA